MGTTLPPYGWRVPLGTDRPAGHTQITTLATDIGATIAALPRIVVQRFQGGGFGATFPPRAVHDYSVTLTTTMKDTNYFVGLEMEASSDPGPWTLIIRTKTTTRVDYTFFNAHSGGQVGRYRVYVIGVAA